jgi:hypothetical protein
MEWTLIAQHGAAIAATSRALIRRSRELCEQAVELRNRLARNRPLSHTAGPIQFPTTLPGALASLVYRDVGADPNQ